MSTDFKNSINIAKYTVIFLGILSNSVTIFVLSRRKLKGSWLNAYFRILTLNNILKNILFAFDTVNSPLSTTFFTGNISCKLSQYFNYVFNAATPWILAFMSIDRYITIRFFRKPNILGTKTFNFAIFALIYSWNFLYYSTCIIYFQSYNSFSDENYNQINLTVFNIADNETICLVLEPETRISLGYLDSFNSTLLPFFVMFLFSILIIIKLFKTRNKISHEKNASYSVKKRLKNDLKFSIIIIILDALFFVFNSPISINGMYSLSNNDFLETFSELYHSIDFFVFFLTNSLFREEFFIIILIRKKENLKNENSKRITATI